MIETFFKKLFLTVKKNLEITKNTTTITTQIINNSVLVKKYR